MKKSFKSGFVTVTGRPNVGKSTLINALTGEHVAITSPKPQTTRKNQLAILTEKHFQIVFLISSSSRGGSQTFSFLSVMIE